MVKKSNTFCFLWFDPSVEMDSLTECSTTLLLPCSDLLTFFFQNINCEDGLWCSPEKMQI